MSVLKNAFCEAPSRREQNKIHTRAAIASATYGLFAKNGYDNITVAQVAEEAGVSRRTFFNYFASIDEALEHYIGTLLDIAVNVLDDLPVDVPLITATERAISKLADRDVLAPLAELYAQSVRTPSLQVSVHAAWAIVTEGLREKLTSYMPDGDHFAFTVYAHTVIGAAKAAFSAWVPTTQEPIDDSDIQNLYTMLNAAMELLKDGFPTIEIPTHTKGA